MAKTLAIVFGIVFVLIGILGWVPNPLVGANGIFLTDHMHDVFHLVTGLVLLIVAFTVSRQSSLWLKIGGVVYLLMAVVGWLMAPNGGVVLGMTVNMADHYLHLVLGIVLLVAGFAGKSGAKDMPAPMAAAPAAPAPSMPASNPPSSGTM